MAALFVAGIGQAQQAESYRPRHPDPFEESWRIRAFPQLKGRELSCIGEDPGGAVWFGVADGAVRYDGLRWDEFGASRNLPGAAIAFARVGGQFFAATWSSIHLLEQGRFRQVFPLDDQDQWVMEGLAAGADGDLWVCTDKGALRLRGAPSRGQGESWQEVQLFTTAEIASFLQGEPLSAGIQVQAVAAADTVRWNTGVGVCLYGQGLDENTVIAVAENGPAAKHGVRVGDRIVGIDGEARRTVFQRELEDDPGKRIQLSVLPKDSVDGSGDVLDLELVCESIEGRYQRFRPIQIADDGRGTVWFATRLGRILSLERNQDGTQKWTHHTRQYELPVIAMPSIVVTDRGLAGVGRNTATECLLRYDGDRWTVIDLPRGIGSSIEASDDGALWVGTNGTVLSVTADGRVVGHGMRDHGIFGNDIFVRKMSDGAVWIAGKGSIALRLEPQGQRWTTYRGLLYQASGVDGDQWFLTDRLSVVHHQGDRWQQYDTGDGLMSQPLRVIVTTSGDVWAAGSHDGVAATARRLGDRWERRLHPELSWAVDRRAVFEDRDQRLWFGAAVNQLVQEGERGGVLRFDGEEWKHFRPTNRLDFVYGIAQTRDGSVWFAGPSLVQVTPEDQFGASVHLPWVVRGFSDALANDQDGDLWIGTRAKGVVKLDGRRGDGLEYRWNVYDESNRISNNRIKSIVSMSDSSVLVGTPAGFDRFDGQTWAAASLPAALAYDTDYGGLHEGRSGELWFNASGLSYLSRDLAKGIPLKKLDARRERFTTYRYRPDRQPPDTVIERSASQATFGETVSLAWSGVDYMEATPRDQLMFSWSVDDQPWSVFSPAVRVDLPGLEGGLHRFRVRARDADFNLDTTPAEITIEIFPALWQRSWFQGVMLLMLVLFCLAMIQTGRVFRQKSSLRTSNERLLSAERDLQQANQSLESRVARRTRELREANQRLHASEVQYRSIVEDQSEYIVRFDADQNVTFVNTAFLRANRIAGQTVSAVLPAKVVSRLRQVVAHVEDGRQEGGSVVSFDDADGRLRWEQWHCRVLVDQIGNLLGYQVVGNDITDLRDAQNRLSEKELELAHLARVSALGEMVAGISHEINQPLATIANFSSASLLVLDRELGAIENVERKEDVRQWIERIKEQTERINRIVNSLRRFGRPGSNLTAFDIESAVTESLDLCEYRTRTVLDEIFVDIPADLPKAYADRVQVEQVLVNLIRNAVDAMDDPAVVERTLKIMVAADQEMLKVSVIDSGPGIAKDQGDEIFQTFVTTKAQGMGMGLAISRSIIESHQGRLYTVDGADGAWFEFTLPIATDDQADPVPARSTDHVPQSRSVSV
ncbi:ATP-binding protein [Stieleria sp. ICT_E10.1]|uniref:ATP-binding protein n=1 Tax=Stieleria sedimenti TaxID=2976331 RepID=UPI00218025A1|nr:ATP-binding protein [Stieleria sedimenti]MCS7469813.1 ATP-binding protein [Stieleria sedimenti]